MDAHGRRRAAAPGRLSRGHSPRSRRLVSNLKRKRPMPESLSKDTQAVLLLCGRFAPREEVQPLDLREYNRVVDLLHKQSLRPAFLVDGNAFDLDWSASGVEPARLRALLGRGMALGLAAER